MGSFKGHAVPGLFLIFVALVRIVEVLGQYFDSHFHQVRFTWHDKVMATSRSPKSCWPNRLWQCLPPLDMMLRFILPIGGIVGEYVTSLDDNWNFVSIHNYQHMTMYCAFILPCTFDLLYYYKVPGLPSGLTYASMALALAIEAVQFLWHLHNRSYLDIQVHKLLIYIIIAGAISSCLLVLFRDNFMLWMSLGGSLLIQGLWFFAIALVLYPHQAPFGSWPTWDQNDAMQGVIIASLFGYIIIGTIMAMTILGVLSYRWKQSRLNVKRLVLASAEDEGLYKTLDQGSKEDMEMQDTKIDE